MKYLHKQYQHYLMLRNNALRYMREISPLGARGSVAWVRKNALEYHRIAMVYKNRIAEWAK